MKSAAHSETEIIYNLEKGVRWVTKQLPSSMPTYITNTILNGTTNLSPANTNKGVTNITTETVGITNPLVVLIDIVASQLLYTAVPPVSVDLSAVIISWTPLMVDPLDYYYTL